MSTNITTHTKLNNEQNLSTIKQLSAQNFLMKLFSKYDLNSDGRLSRFQFAQIIKYLTRVTGATYPQRPDVDDIFSYLDTDGDLTISKDEFRLLTQCLQSLITREGLHLLYKGKL